MPETIAAPPAGAPAATTPVSTPGSGGTTTPGAGTGTTTPPVVIPGSTPDAGGTTPPAEAGGEVPKNPKFKFSLDEGETPTEIDFTDVVPEDVPVAGEAEAFKFESLDAIKESNPDLYKSLKTELSKAKRYSEYAKTPETIKAQNDRLSKIEKDVIGSRADGKTGLDAIEATLGDLANVVVGIQNGDKDIVAKFFTEGSQMGNTMGEMLTQWAKADGKAHDAYVASKAISVLTTKDAGGVSAADALTSLYNVVKDNPEAVKLLQRAAYSINQLSSQADFKPDPNAAISAREAEVKKQEATIWKTQTDMEVQPLVRTSLRKGLSALTSEMKRDMTGDERTEHMDYLEKAFFKHASQDAEFVRKLNELGGKLDREGIKGLIKQSRGKYVTFALKDLYRAKFANRAAIRAEASSKSEAGGGGSAGGDAKGVTLQYAGKMKHGAPDVAYDYDRMRSENPDMLYDHEFYIQGKREKYRW